MLLPDLCHQLCGDFLHFLGIGLEEIELALLAAPALFALPIVAPLVEDVTRPETPEDRP